MERHGGSKQLCSWPATLLQVLDCERLKPASHVHHVLLPSAVAAPKEMTCRWLALWDQRLISPAAAGLRRCTARQRCRCIPAGLLPRTPAVVLPRAVLSSHRRPRPTRCCFFRWRRPAHPDVAGQSPQRDGVGRVDWAKHTPSQSM